MCHRWVQESSGGDGKVLTLGFDDGETAKFYENNY